MQGLRAMMWSQLALLAVASLTFLVTSPASAQDAGFDAKTVNAWTRAGMRAGWISTEVMSEVLVEFKLQKPDHSTALPCFGGWTNGFKNLPEPKVAFGIMLDPLITGNTRALNRAVVTEAMLKDLARFKKLEMLSAGLNGTPAVLNGLAGISSLTSLRVRFIRPEGFSLKPLARLTGLKALAIQTTQANTSGMPAVLVRQEGRITDADLKELTALTNLEILDLRNSQVTDAGLPTFADFPNLEVLDLSFSKVTDAGLAELLKAKKLKTLLLSNNVNIGNRGVQTLAAHPSLERVWVKDTMVTEQGIQDAQKSNPKLVVVRH